MKAQVSKLCLSLAALLAGTTLWPGCGPATNPPIATTGSVNATLKMYVGGSTQGPCTAPAISWTASSTAGSTQTKTSPAVDNGTSQCETITTEGGQQTICYCPVSISFTGLAPGSWTIQAGNYGCSVTVTAGNTSTVTIFTDGRACTHFP